MNTASFEPITALNADLHCHSTVSDGTRSPTWLAQHAHDQGVQLWALTDHDEVGGIAEARQAASALGLAFLSGVEISVSWQEKTIHIVGLGFDENHPALVEGLRRTRGGREERAREMSEQLAQVGIHGAYEGALKYVGNPDLISRSHFGRFLVEAGVCRDIPEVFRRFLTEGKPGFVPHQWATLDNAVHWIVQAGGMAIVAHPARYGLTPAQEQMLFAEFKRAGGLGLEVVTSAHTDAEMAHYAQVAREWGFYASRGSDFHSPDESRVALGDIPRLPEGLSPVWQALVHRIQMPQQA